MTREKSATNDDNSVSWHTGRTGSILRAQRYNIRIVYKKGQHMYIADTLSRAYLQGNDQREAVEKELETVHMADYLPFSDGRLKEIQRITESDDTLKTLKNVILQG